VAEARRRAEAFAVRWGARYAGELDILPDLTVHVRSHASTGPGSATPT
jgi:hypothetical protein